MKPFAFLAIFLALSSAFAADCGLTAEPTTFLKDVSPADYRQTKTRSLSTLETMFGSQFKSIVAQLPLGARIFDAGGGYSFYGLELAMKGYRVTTVSLHDFYKILLQLSRRDRLRAYYIVSPERIERRREGVPKAEDLPVLASILQIPYSGVNEAELADFFTMVKDRIEMLEADGRFVRETGLVQSIAARTPSGVYDLYIDMFGAFAYSTDRWEQVQAAYRVVKPGGHAFFRAPQHSTFVINHRHISLPRHLAATVQMFSFEPYGFEGSLILSKPVANAPDVIPVCYKKISEVTLGGHSFPTTQYAACSLEKAAADK